MRALVFENRSIQRDERPICGAVARASEWSPKAAARSACEGVGRRSNAKATDEAGEA